MIVYRIRNWSAHFENATSRKIDHCRYVCMPNKQDGVGLTRILAERDGAAIFGVWCLILQACSRQIEREGWLTHDGSSAGQPWAFDDLAMRWRRPVSEIERAIAFCCTRKIGWMEALQSKWVPDPTEPGRTGPDGMEGREGIEGREAPPGGAADAPAHDPEDLTSPSEQPPTPQVANGLGAWVRWHAKEPDRERENLDELASLVGKYTARVVQAAAERIVTREHRKAWPNELLPEIMGLKPSEEGNPRTTIVQRLIASHGWERCADASGIPRGAIGSPAAMEQAMVADLDIHDRVVAALGAA